MNNKDEKKSFREILNEDRPDDPLTEEEAEMALQNLGELIWLLYKINDREGIVSPEELRGEVLPQTHIEKKPLRVFRTKDGAFQFLESETPKRTRTKKKK